MRRFCSVLSGRQHVTHTARPVPQRPVMQLVTLQGPVLPRASPQHPVPQAPFAKTTGQLESTWDTGPSISEGNTFPTSTMPFQRGRRSAKLGTE